MEPRQNTAAPAMVPRKAPRDPRRLHLIEAAVEVLAARGHARMALTDVAQAARLPLGLVNVHFKTRDLLLAETLAFLAEDHRQTWRAALEAAPSDPASQLDAVLSAGFAPHAFTPARLGAWCAFRADPQCRPIYLAECADGDADYAAQLERLVAALVAAGGYPIDPARAARVLRATAEGIRQDLGALRGTLSRGEALATLYACAAAFFPRHFSEAGPIAGGLAQRPGLAI
ncbi:MAG: TetR/AcrR family transcriptional regulator [Gemmobacter sp.]